MTQSASQDYMREYLRVYRAANPDRFKEYGARHRTKVKSVVWAAYGNRCNCCGETTAVFLTLDHVNGGGRIDLKSSSSNRIYSRVIKEGFPPDYQLLCWNCNFAKHYLKACPHKTGSCELPPVMHLSSAYKRRVIARVRAAYGNACACCEETIPVFLTIDHVNGGGKLDYANHSTYAICARIVKAGFPPEFQILCWNCNSGKHMCGTCPHSSKEVILSLS